MVETARHAFGDLEARVDALAGATPLDRIALKEHIVDVEIGAFHIERDIKQRLRFSIVVEVYPLEADAADDVDNILSYDALTEAVGHELAAERLNLLETLAERIAQRILLQPQAARVFLRIEKLDRGAFILGVEIVRGREAADTSKVEAAHVHPKVLYLSEAVCDDDICDLWLERAARSDAPVVVCLAPLATASEAPSEIARKRMDLLSIEQRCWQLSERHSKVIVTGTKTELDWAMKNHRVALWAPSKLVMDAVDGPSGPVGDGRDLALWVAHQLSAQMLITVGAATPEGGDVPRKALAAAPAISL